MMPISARDADYESFEILGHDAVVTDSRINRDTIPEGLYAYDLRHSDDDWGEICGLANKVVVNFFGTVITKTPIPNVEHEIDIHEDQDVKYSGATTLDEFISKSA